MILWDSVYRIPNELTISAMRELKTNDSLTAYSSVEELESSIMEDETTLSHPRSFAKDYKKIANNPQKVAAFQRIANYLIKFVCK